VIRVTVGATVFCNHRGCKAHLDSPITRDQRRRSR
jgi:hypothetical protein